MAQTVRKKRNRGAVWGPLSFLLAVAAAVFGMSVFFRVHDVTVSGNVRYTAEEIVLASGIEEGDNLFFINRGTATARINARLPYVEQAWIERSLPNRLEIHITESDAVASLTASDGTTWVLDRGCKLLATAGADETEGLIAVSGLSPVEPEVGERLSAPAGEEPKVAYLADILGMISDLGMQEDVTAVDITDYASPSFRYLGRFTVKLGEYGSLAYKFQLMLSAIAKMSEGDRGTLDVGIDNRAHLTYD